MGSGGPTGFGLGVGLGVARALSYGAQGLDPKPCFLQTSKPQKAPSKP